MSKQILFVPSEWGYRGEELIGPLEACDAAGYTITFVTPTGKKTVPLGASVNPEFIDPPLGKSVTSQEMAKKTRTVDNSGRLDHPRSLTEWFPQQPLHSSATFLRDAVGPDGEFIGNFGRDTSVIVDWPFHHRAVDRIFGGMRANDD